MDLVAIRTADDKWGVWNLNARKWQPRVRRFDTKKEAQTKITQLTGANK